MTVGTNNIHELEVVPKVTATIYPSKSEQPFVDPAILSYDRLSVQKPSQFQSQSSTGVEDSLAAPSLKPKVPVETKPVEDAVASATLTEPFNNLSLHGSPAHAVTQDQDDEAAQRGKGRKKRRRRPLRSNNDEVPEIYMTPAQKRNNGWGEPPFLKETPTNKGLYPQIKEGSARKKNNTRRRDLHEDQNGWATEEATDIQDLGDFDFEGNLSKFDKKGLFDQIKQEDTTADEARLVSFNRLPARLGTNGSRNLHYTENVLDSPKQNGKANWSSSEDSAGRAGKISSERSSRRALSRASVRKAPSRKGSAVVGQDTHPPSATLPRFPSFEYPDLQNKGKSSSSRYTSSKASISTKPCFQLASSGLPCACITPLQMLELEQLAISQCGLSDDILDENAARSIAQLAIKITANEHVVILAGNNKSGARAIAAGRQLLNHGTRVSLFLLGIEREHDLLDTVRRHLTMYRNSGGQISKLERLLKIDQNGQALDGLIIDALLGMHFSFDDLGTADQAACFELVRWMNEGHAMIVSIDVPSGLDASTGMALLSDHFIYPHPVCLSINTVATLTKVLRAYILSHRFNGAFRPRQAGTLTRGSQDWTSRGSCSEQ